MELYVSGVKVPKLGSLQDRILRNYLTKRASREVGKNKLLAQIATAVGGESKEWSSAISRIWSDYVNMEFFLEGADDEREADMKNQFEYWTKVKPVIVKDKDGKLSVKGLS